MNAAGTSPTSRTVPPPHWGGYDSSITPHRRAPVVGSPKKLPVTRTRCPSLPVESARRSSMAMAGPGSAAWLGAAEGGTPDGCPGTGDGDGFVGTAAHAETSRIDTRTRKPALERRARGEACMRRLRKVTADRPVRRPALPAG